MARLLMAKTVARWTLLALLVVLMMSAPPRASAQDAPAAPASDAKKREPTKEELAAARQLFNEALALEKEEVGDWQGALTKLEKVAQIKMTPQVRYHIALCHEHLGRLVEAINGFELAVQEARTIGKAGRDVLENAPQRAENLRGRVAHLRLIVKGTVRSSKIYLDGRNVSLALIDTEIPVDPGKHRLEVKRGDLLVSEQELELAEKQSESITLEIDDPEIVPPTPTTTATTPPPPPPSRLPAYITGGAGAAALIGSGVFYALREATIANVRVNCDANDRNCHPADVGTADLGKAYTITSQVLLGVGAAALATGVVLWFVLAPNDDPAAAPAEKAKKEETSGLSLGISPTAGGLQLVGRW